MKTSSMRRITMVILGLTCMSLLAGSVSAGTLVRKSENPNACENRNNKWNTSCHPWNALDELSSPNAWKYTREFKESKVAWYGVEGEVAVAEPRIITLEGVHFDFDKWNIRPDAAVILDRNIAELRSSNITIHVVGYTDSIGSDTYNQRLSERRANSVRTYFVNHGIDADRITAEGRGEDGAIAPNTLNGKDNPEGRAKNRRIELEIRNR